MLGIAVALLVGCALSFFVFSREQASRKGRRQHDELSTILCEGQSATLLRLPTQQTIKAEADAQKHIAHVS